MYSSPRLLIVPHGASVLEEQDACLICSGQWRGDFPKPDHCCMGGYPVMLPCGHIFGSDCISERFYDETPTCPLCAQWYRVHDKDPGLLYLGSHCLDILEDENLGPYVFRWLVLFCLSPLFIPVDAIMGCGPTKQTPRNPLGTLKALFQAIGFQLGTLVLAIPNIFWYLLNALLDAMIELLDTYCPWVWYPVDRISDVLYGDD